jgi:nucleotide-binding universal stress UspA family protein
MFKRVVWATDGSDDADQALPHAKTFATDGGGVLIVVHCEERTLPGKGGGSFPRNANEDELQEKIKRQVADLSNEGVQASLHLVKSQVGGAAHAIAELATAEQADVIVVGTRGHTVLVGLLVGSVAQRLLHIATCPVLVVPALRSA